MGLLAVGGSWLHRFRVPALDVLFRFEGVIWLGTCLALQAFDHGRN